MANRQQVPSPVKRLSRLSWFLLALWTAGIAGSLTWNLYEQEAKVRNIAINTARITFEKDVLYRKWGARQGGVYVPVTDHTPPNPYLNVPDRDITASSGVALTLVNPAYMTRLVNAEAVDARGSRSHITSLKPIRPENRADPWETAALEAFEAGGQEVSSIEEMSDGEFVRFMRPFVTEQSCLKCHASQGYKEGDIRGGVSISVPTASLRAIERPMMARMSLIHLVLWLAGVVGIVISKNGLTRQISSRERAEEALRRQEDWLRVTLTSIGDAVIATDASARVTFLNPVAVRLTGWTQEEAAGQPVDRVFSVINEKTRQTADDMVAQVLRDKRIVVLANDTVLVTKDGREVPIEDSAAPILDTAGNVVGVVLVFHDVTAKRQAQEAIRRHIEELRVSNEELARFNRAMVDRELCMVELKKEVNELRGRVGDPQCYPLDFAKEQP